MLSVFSRGKQPEFEMKNNTSESVTAFDRISRLYIKKKKKMK